MFYVGGNCRNSNVELHDVRFSIGETPEDCHADLREQWWGDPESLHLDCWGAVEQADGFDIVLTKDAPQEGTDKLFFVNLGGYNACEFTELHRNVLLVAPDAKAAKAKALSQIGSWSLPHKDKLFESRESDRCHRATTGLRISPAPDAGDRREAVQIRLRLSADRVKRRMTYLRIVIPLHYFI